MREIFSFFFWVVLSAIFVSSARDEIYYFFMSEILKDLSRKNINTKKIFNVVSLDLCIIFGALCGVKIYAFTRTLSLQSMTANY